MRGRATKTPKDGGLKFEEARLTPHGHASPMVGSASALKVGPALSVPAVALSLAPRVTRWPALLLRVVAAPSLCRLRVAVFSLGRLRVGRPLRAGLEVSAPLM